MILIVDDDSTIRSSLSFALKRAGYECESVAFPHEALAVVRRIVPQLVLMDMNYSRTTTGEEGLMLLRQMKVFQPTVPIILITAWGSIQLAVQGMRHGAFDFITKPFNNHQLLSSIETALNLAQSVQTVVEGVNFEKIIGKSSALQQTLRLVARIAPTDAAVLITGESGTGKELIAEAIHRHSRRTAAPFVKVNLGGISPNLFESEMFGHKKGAFTDAYSDRIGRFELADGGTIFLDEIGELELALQVKLLRVLQEKTFEKLGDSYPKQVNVRVVSATNRNIDELVADRLFREDLLYRINLITINLPPLRERSEDIPLLASYFLEEQAHDMGWPTAELTPSACAYLQSLPFYGNIRELKNLVQRVLLLSGKEMLDVDDIVKTSSTTFPESNGVTTLESIEKENIRRTIQQCEGNLTQAALALGISRQALYRRIEKYDI